MSSNPRPGFAPFSTRSLYKFLPASILRFPVSVIAPLFLACLSILISLFHFPSSTLPLLFFPPFSFLLFPIQPTFHVLSFLS